MNRRQFLLLSTLTTLLTACGKSTQAATEQKMIKQAAVKRYWS
ncbi:hypothetical protein [Oceanospirillum beijerinckii]|nr:hypothetical protein [Oceanospirillum beijerinckii]